MYSYITIIFGGIKLYNYYSWCPNQEGMDVWPILPGMTGAHNKKRVVPCGPGLFSRMHVKLAAIVTFRVFSAAVVNVYWYSNSFLRCLFSYCTYCWLHNKRYHANTITPTIIYCTRTRYFMSMHVQIMTVLYDKRHTDTVTLYILLSCEECSSRRAIYFMSVHVQIMTVLCDNRHTDTVTLYILLLFLMTTFKHTHIHVCKSNVLFCQV